MQIYSYPFAAHDCRCTTHCRVDHGVSKFVIDSVSGLSGLDHDQHRFSDAARNSGIVSLRERLSNLKRVGPGDRPIVRTARCSRAGQLRGIGTHHGGRPVTPICDAGWRFGTNSCPAFQLGPASLGDEQPLQLRGATVRPARRWAPPGRRPAARCGRGQNHAIPPRQPAHAGTVGPPTTNAADGARPDTGDQC